MPDLAPARELRFGHVVVRPGARQLIVDGRPAAVGARAFDVLMALVERRDRVVGKDELLDVVWPGVVVEENNLQVQISGLRRLLGATAIATVPGRGYRFVLEPVLDPPGTGSPPDAPLHGGAHAAGANLPAAGAASPAAAPEPARAAARAPAPAPAASAAAPVAAPRKVRIPLVSLAALVLAVGLTLLGMLLRPVAVPSGTAAAPLRSVLVVPFAAAMEDGALVTAASRLAYDVTSALGDSVRQVRVVPATRAAAFAGRAGDAPAIGREANVRFVVEGDVRVAGAEVVVTLRLFDTQDGRQLDTARTFAQASDLADTGELGLRLTSRLRVMVSQAITDTVRAGGEEKASAQDLVDLAGAVPIRDPAANAREARRLASAAIERAPSLASAWAARADAGTMLYFTDFTVDPQATREEIDADSFQAVTLDPKDVTAWVARANALRIRGNMEGAFAALDRAQELDPSRFMPQHVRGWFYLDAGSPEETLRIVARLRPALGQQHSGAAVQACSAHLLLGAYDEAIVECERVVSWDLWNVPANLAAAHAMRGDDVKAAAARDMLLKIAPAFTISRYEERFNAGLTPRGRALDQAHFVAGLRRAGVPE